MGACGMALQLRRQRAVGKACARALAGEISREFFKEPRMQRYLAALVVALVLGAVPARAEEAVRFGTDWLAAAEYAGYYQAVANGIYRKHGLDVTIRQGGPGVNPMQQLMAGRLDFAIASNAFIALNFVKGQLPFRVVAAIYQKDPSVLIAHPDVGHDSFPQLKGSPIMISPDTRASWWNFLRAKYGYSDAQIRPYTFNLQPFLADKMAVQQGVLGSEPYSIKQAGVDPVVMLIADNGFLGYAQMLVASDKMIRARPDLVHRFVDASIEGWYSYLYVDPKPGHASIKQNNPEMTDDLLTYGRDALLKNGILDSGDAERIGIGGMTDARWASFLRSMVQQSLYPADLDVKKAYTLDFVNRKVGIAIKRRN
jgi:NitT/TauT family transport system substrate-binding protein